MTEYQGPDYLPSVNNRKLDKVYKTTVFRHWAIGSAGPCCQRSLTRSEPLDCPVLPRAGPKLLHREQLRTPEMGVRDAKFARIHWAVQKRMEVQRQNFGDLQKGPFGPLAER